MERLLSDHTVTALKKQSTGYVSKDKSELDVVIDLQKKYGLSHMHRFDIGKNTDGFSPIIHETLATPQVRHNMVNNILDYPDPHYTALRKQLAHRFGLPHEYFILGTGIESFLDHITRATLNAGDTYMLPVPNFYLFEDLSDRMGAVPYTIPLQKGTLRWTPETTDAIIQGMAEQNPKLLWISNPINPTGQHIPLKELQRIVESGNTKTILIIDEAYGECSDTDSGYITAAEFVENTPNLIVLRTFSKLYGLPGARVGYMLCSSPTLRNAIHYYRPYFPLSWISPYLAQLALLDESYIVECRNRMRRRRSALLMETKHLASFQFLPSCTNTLMFRHASLSADTLFEELAKRSILTANINGITGIKGEQFLRMTLRNHKDNELFIQACREIDAASSHSVKI